MPMPGPDWTGLLQRVVDGDGLAFVQASRLVNSFLVRWDAYAFREEWDDLVQEVIAAGALALREGRPFGVTFVPEPGTGAMLGAGMAGLSALANRRSRGSGNR